MRCQNLYFFKDTKLSWWQAALLKIATMSFGILLALHFTDFLKQYITLFWFTWLIPGIYVIYIYFKQGNK